MVDRRKLDSWKEIAAFLGRDERTVRRWEKTRGLPVRRIPGGKRNAVFAYTDDITRWLEGRDAGPPDHSGIHSQAVERRAVGRSSHMRLLAFASVVVAAVLIAVTGLRTLDVVRWASGTRPAVGIDRHARPAASAAYLRGRYFLNERSVDGYRRAIEAFNQALTLDPKSAASYAGLADTYCVMGMAASPPSDTLPKAKAAAAKALELDGRLADAHTSLAVIDALYDWNWAGAEHEFAVALKLDPNYALGHYWYGTFDLAPERRLSEAVAEIRRAQELDPSALFVTAGLGQAYYFARQYRLAEEQARQALDRNPTFGPAFALLEYSYRERHMFTEALTTAIASVDPRAGGPPAGRSFDSSDYKRFLQRRLVSLEEQGAHGYVSPYMRAYYHAAAGEDDLALAWLEKAVQQHHPALVFIAVEPVFDRLRGSREFQEIQRAVGLP